MVSKVKMGTTIGTIGLHSQVITGNTKSYKTVDREQ